MLCALTGWQPRRWNTGTDVRVGVALSPDGMTGRARRWEYWHAPRLAFSANGDVMLSRTATGWGGDRCYLAYVADASRTVQQCLGRNAIG